jgi:hypothetical protein
LAPPHFPVQFGLHPQTLAFPLPPQVSGETQVSWQVPPHPSAPPHFPLQFGVHPQTLAFPLPPQVSGETQVLGQVPPHPLAPPHFPLQFGVQHFPEFPGLQQTP